MKLKKIVLGRLLWLFLTELLWMATSFFFSVLKVHKQPTENCCNNRIVHSRFWRLIDISNQACFLTLQLPLNFLKCSYYC